MGTRHSIMVQSYLKIICTDMEEEQQILLILQQNSNQQKIKIDVLYKTTVMGITQQQIDAQQGRQIKIYNNSMNSRPIPFNSCFNWQQAFISLPPALL